MKLLSLLLLLMGSLGNSYSPLQLHRHEPSDSCILFKSEINGYEQTALVGLPDRRSIYVLSLKNGEHMLPSNLSPQNVRVTSRRPNSFVTEFESNKADATCFSECTLKKTDAGSKLDCVETQCSRFELINRAFKNVCDAWEASNG